MRARASEYKQIQSKKLKPRSQPLLMNDSASASEPRRASASLKELARAHTSEYSPKKYQNLNHSHPALNFTCEINARIQVFEALGPSLNCHPPTTKKVNFNSRHPEIRNKRKKKVGKTFLGFGHTPIFMALHPKSFSDLYSPK